MFIAAELPSELRDALSETSAALRDSIRGRWTPPNTFHITLAFLGDTDEWLIDDLAAIMEDACRASRPISATLGPLGHFGRSDSAVLWQGLQDPKPLERIAKQLRRGLDEAEIEYDGKGFKAHVTLMRNADLGSGTLPLPHIASGTVKRITLFRSEFTDRGMRYTPLASVDLQA